MQNKSPPKLRQSHMDNQSVTMNQIIHCSLAISEYSSSKLPCCYVISDKSAPHKRSYSRTGCVAVLNLNMNGITSTVFQKRIAHNMLELIDVDFFNSRFFWNSKHCLSIIIINIFSILCTLQKLLTL